MKQLRSKIVRLGAGLSALTTGSALAQEGGISGGIQAADTGENPASIEEIIQNVIQVLLFIVGVAAVVMLIIGGIRYIVSSGDQQAVAGAKNTIIYSIVGLVVAVLAWVAVDWVFGLLQG